MVCAGCQKRREKLKAFKEKWQKKRDAHRLARELAKAVESKPVYVGVDLASEGADHHVFSTQLPDGRHVVIDPTTMEESKDG